MISTVIEQFNIVHVFCHAEYAVFYTHQDAKFATHQHSNDINILAWNNLSKIYTVKDEVSTYILVLTRGIFGRIISKESL